MHKYHWHNKKHHEGKYWHQYGNRIIHYKFHSKLAHQLDDNRWDAKWDWEDKKSNPYARYKNS